MVVVFRRQFRCDADQDVSNYGLQYFSDDSADRYETSAVHIYFFCQIDHGSK